MKRPKTLTQYELNKLTEVQQREYRLARAEYRRIHPPSALQTLTRKRNFNIGRCAMLRWHIRDLALTHLEITFICDILDRHEAMLRRHNEEQKAIK